MTWKDTTLPEYECPWCGRQMDAATGKDCEPIAGDFAVCIHCAAPSVFIEDLKLRRAEPADLAKLDAAEAAELARYQMAVRLIDPRNLLTNGSLIEKEHVAIEKVRERAVANPVDVPGLAARLATEAGKDAYRRQMTTQTIALPPGWLCTFSIETGHPCGTARHLSVSRSGDVPHPTMIADIARAFGFTGGLSDWICWSEVLEGHGLEGYGTAVNIVQPIDASTAIVADKIERD